MVSGTLTDFELASFVQHLKAGPEILSSLTIPVVAKFFHRFFPHVFRRFCGGSCFNIEGRFDKN